MSAFSCQRSDFSRVWSAGGGPALGHNGGVQALAEFGGELVDLVLAVDGDGLAGGVEDDLAVVALADVGLDFGEEFGFYLAVEVVGELSEEVGAGHGVGPPLGSGSPFCLK